MTRSTPRRSPRRARYRAAIILFGATLCASLTGSAAAAAQCELARAPALPSKSGASHPSMLLDAAEISAIKARVAAGAEPWVSAYRGLIERANLAKRQPARSVRSEGAAGADYFTGAPYCGWGTGASSPCGQDCCDGVSNPNTDRADYEAAIAISHAVRDLGLAYAFTADASYAEHAVLLMRHWAVDGATAMAPKLTNTSSEIELAITMPAMFYGADLIWSYPNWPDRQAFVRWAAALAADARTRNGGTAVQNFGDWRMLLLGSAAVLSEDEALLSYVFDHYKALVPNQISARGELVLETDRTRGLFYSLYAVNAIAQVCELARHRGVDLYNFATADGRGSLRRALDWLAPYALDPASWPYEQITPLNPEDSIASFELGYLAWGKTSYLNVLQRYGRPLDDIRTAGPLTLTHARGAYAWQLSASGPVSGAAITANVRHGAAPLLVMLNGAQSLLSGLPPEQYAWNFGDGTSSTQAGQLHVFSAPGCYPVTLSVRRGSEQRAATLNIRADPPLSALLEAGAAWNNRGFPAQLGRFTLTFDLSPRAYGMDGVVGAAPSDVNGYEDVAASVRFSSAGLIEARNGGVYAAQRSVRYVPGGTYRVRMEIDVINRRYSVFVTPPGSAELPLASGYAFRAEQASAPRLTHVAAYASSGSLRVTNLQLITP